MRKLRLGAAAACIGAAATVVTLVLASAGGAVAPSTFESADGNLVVDATGAKDWANAPNLSVKLDKTPKSADDAFGQGAKEDISNPSVVTGSIPPNKSDLSRFYVSHEVVNGQIFLYLAWERTNVLGNANMDFEFNQSTTIDGNGVTPVRTPGDMLITFDFVNGGGSPVLSLRRWIGPSATGHWSDPVDLSKAGFADGAVNLVDVVDPINPGAPRTLPALTFGEAGINLTAANIFPPNQCVNFASAYLKSRSSASFTAELKDFIAPATENISNCGTVVGHKYKDANADGIWQQNETQGLSSFTFQLKDSFGNVLQTAVSNSSGVYTFTQVPPGSYTVHEVSASNPTAWVQTLPANFGDRTVTVTGGATSTVAPFLNTPLSTINVNFTADAVIPGTSTPATHASISCDGGPPSTDGTLTVSGLKIGTHTCTVVITDP